MILFFATLVSVTVLVGRTPNRFETKLGSLSPAKIINEAVEYIFE